MDGFRSIRRACALILSNKDTSMILVELCDAVRGFDDQLEHIAPRGYADPWSNVTARAALQSLQWSLIPVSVLRRTKTSFRYLRNCITVLAKAALEQDHAQLEKFDGMVSQLEDLLEDLDRAMQQVFHSEAPYVTSLFVQLQYPHTLFQPSLDNWVMF